MSTTAVTTRWHSQPQTEQDQWVVTRTGRQHHGYFVEIGGYDGQRHSNTLALEESFDWTGLLVEPNPILYSKLVGNRPNCAHANVAVGPVEGIGNFIVGDAFSGLVEFMPDAWYEEHRRRGNPLLSVETVTLSRLLDAHKAPECIDYLSLDVEGAEFAILEEFMRCPKYIIRYMSVEHRNNEQLLQNLVKLLAPMFYLDHVKAWDAFFQHKVWA